MEKSPRLISRGFLKFHIKMMRAICENYLDFRPPGAVFAIVDYVYASVVLRDGSYVASCHHHGSQPRLRACISSTFSIKRGMGFWNQPL